MLWRALLVCGLLTGWGSATLAASTAPASTVAPTSSSTAAAPATVPTSVTGTVAGVIDGDTLTLTDGRVVRLAGIQAPKLLPVGGRGGDSRAWPLAEDAKTYLASLVLGWDVRLRWAAAREDRHGRLQAHVERADGVWVQGALLRAGLARVFTTIDTRARAGDMLALETEARAAHFGLWGHRFYALRSTEPNSRDFGSFQIVEGRVLTVKRNRNQIFLNFGPDWRSDFTVRIPREAFRRFEEHGVALLKLQGQMVRVRGYLARRNGPMIELTHPEALELVPSSSPPSPLTTLVP